MSAHVLVTCGGKWVGMIEALRAAAQAWAPDDPPRIYVGDRDPLTPAGCFADAHFTVPGIADPDYVDALIQLCTDEEVGVIVPLIDIDLAVLVQAKERFAENGVHLVSGAPDAVDLCMDKQRFAEFCSATGLPMPRTWRAGEVADFTGPLIIKPRRGFGSIGIARVDSRDELAGVLEGTTDVIVQEFVKAPEISVDGYVNREGRCVLLVPRTRAKVVGGEAQRSETIDDRPSWELALRTVEALGREGLGGPVNVQMFQSEPRRLIEVNARLGSCSVLSNAATEGRLLRHVLEEATGGTASDDPDDYERGLSIYRYTGDVFHRGAEQRHPYRVGIESRSA